MSSRIERTTEAAVRWVLSHRRWTAAVILSITAASLALASTTEFESSLEIWFVDDDPELEIYRRFRQTFDADELAVVGVFAPHALSGEDLESLDRVTRAIGALPRVARATSIVDARCPSSDPEILGLVPLFAERPITPGAAAAAIVRIAKEEPIEGALMSNDGRATAILVAIAADVISMEDKVAVVEEIRKLASLLARNGTEVVVTGTPAINEAVVRHSQRDFATVGAAALILIILLCALIFRGTIAALIPLLVVAIAVSWTFGLMAGLGIRLNLVSQALLTVLLAVGVADSVHVLVEVRAAMSRGETSADAIVSAAKTLAVPCFFTTLTTALGLLSLLSSRLAPIAQFGWLAAIGVTFALVATFSLIPVFVFDRRAPPSTLSLFAPISIRLSRQTVFVDRAVLIVALGATIAAIAGASKLEVGSNPGSYFLPNDPVRLDMQRVDGALGGSTSIELLATSSTSLARHDALIRLRKLQDWLEGLPSAQRSTSIADFYRAANLGVTGEDAIPSDPQRLAQLRLLLEGEPSLEHFVSSDERSGRISVRVSMSEAAALSDHLPEVQAKLDREASGASLHVRPTGFVKMISQMELYIVDSQLRGGLLAFLLVSAMMVVLFGSLRIGLFAMIPNLLPVVWGVGLMRVFDIQVDPGTAMVGSIALGLVVDDTVHLLSRLQRALRLGEPIEVALDSAIRTVGPAMTSTSAILVAGFGVLTFGSFTPNIYLGLVASAVIIFAWIADLIVLPAAIRVFRPRL